MNVKTRFCKKKLEKNEKAFYIMILTAYTHFT